MKSRPGGAGSVIVSAGALTTVSLPKIAVATPEGYHLWRRQDGTKVQQQTSAISSKPCATAIYASKIDKTKILD